MWFPVIPASLLIAIAWAIFFWYSSRRLAQVALIAIIIYSLVFFYLPTSGALWLTAMLLVFMFWSRRAAGACTVFIFLAIVACVLLGIFFPASGNYALGINIFWLCIAILLLTAFLVIRRGVRRTPYRLFTLQSLL